MRVIDTGFYYDYLSDSFLNSVQLSMSTGCSSNCSFCPIPEQEGAEVCFTSSVDLEKELVELAEKGIEYINFADDNFLLFAAEMERVFINLASQGFKFAFSFPSPVKQVIKNQKYLISLRHHGLRSVNLKLTNVNQDVLSRYQIKDKPDEQDYAIQILQALRCQVQLSYILFEPLTTIAHLQNGLNFLEKSKLIGLTPYEGFLLTYLDLDIDTPIAREYRSRHLFLPSSDEYLPYQIMEKEAQEIFHWLAYFSVEFGPRWDHLYQQLLETRMVLAKMKPNWMVTNRGQELLHIIYDLRVMPFDLFRELLSSAKQSALETISSQIDSQSVNRLLTIEKNYRQYRTYYDV